MRSLKNDNHYSFIKNYYQKTQKTSIDYSTVDSAFSLKSSIDKEDSGAQTISLKDQYVKIFILIILVSEVYGEFVQKFH